MRCFNCERVSWRIFCEDCKLALKDFECGKRNLGEFGVYYFYKYEMIKHILHTKHHLCGWFALRSFAKIVFEEFLAQNGEIFAANEFVLLPIDDVLKGGYSHTALIAKQFSHPSFTTHFGGLRTQNSVTYSGKSLQFRQENSREFKLSLRAKNLLLSSGKPAVLLDDIITSGETMKQAAAELRRHGVEVAFGIVLADAGF